MTCSEKGQWLEYIHPFLSVPSRTYDLGNVCFCQQKRGSGDTVGLQTSVRQAL